MFPQIYDAGLTASTHKNIFICNLEYILTKFAEQSQESQNKKRQVFKKTTG